MMTSYKSKIHYTIRYTCFSLLITFAELASPEILILTPPNDTETVQIAQRIQQKITSKEKIIVSSNLQSNTDYSLVVTLGASALEQHASNIQSPHLSSFISSFDYETFKKPLHEDTSAIFSTSDPDNLLKSIAETFGPARIGYVYSGEDRYLEALIERSKYYNLAIEATPVIDKKLFKAYRKLYRRSIDVMLVTNNSTLYNQHNIRHVLDSLYRQRIPVATFSKRLIKNGSGVTASIYVPTNVMIDKTAQAIDSFLTSKKLHVATYGDSVELIIDDEMISRYASIINDLKNKAL